MERLWADSSGQDSYDPYTCAVYNAIFLECLDIAGPRTLGNSLSDIIAYNTSGAAGDLNKNFYAVLALEGLLNMTGENVTGHFGGDVTCSGKIVGDGAVNAYDIATLMWYQFKFEPYDQLPNDPSTVSTVQGRDDTGYRCNLGESRRMWQLAVGEDYCHSGHNADTLGYDTQRRLSQGVVPERNILSNNLFEAYRNEPIRPSLRQLTSTVESTALEARETRLPSARRAAVNRDDMLRNVNAMRTLDIDVAEWGVVAGYGRWIRMRAPGVQVAMELYVAGLSVDEPVHLSLQGVPRKNCTACKPIDDDPRKVVIAFARRTEYEDEYANSMSLSEEVICANIVPATVQSSAMIGNTIALRQQPPNRACGFDLFIWIPSFPTTGVHVSKQASPFSFSARRLAAVGAESSVTSTLSGCDSDIGVLAGSSAMDGFRGQIQRVSSCARYGFTQPDIIKPVETGVVQVAQCAAASCNAHAPTRADVISRSFHLFASSGMESAYTDSLQILKMTQRGQDQTLMNYPLVPNRDYVTFESMLARESQGNNCCIGYVCTPSTHDNLYQNTTASCQLQSSHPGDVTIHPEPPPLPPPSTPHNLYIIEEVVFEFIVEASTWVNNETGVNNETAFNQTDYKIQVSLELNESMSSITLQILPVPGTAYVVVTTTIRPEYHAATTVKTTIGEILMDYPTQLVFGVQVHSVSSQPVVHIHYYDAPPTSPPHGPPLTPIVEDDNNMGLVLGLTLGCAFIAVVVAGMVWNFKTTTTVKEKNDARHSSEKALLRNAASPSALRAERVPFLRTT